MQYVIKGYEPARLFQIFEEITAIPRGSGNEAGIAAFVMDFAARLGLAARTDEYHNVIVYKPATAGHEGSAPIMIQGHLDMVNETAAGRQHDWAVDGPQIIIDDRGIISADGTTLGADDGAAVAMMLAVLEDREASHPPLECVFTVQEETGLTGAGSLDPEWVSARRMINLDSEKEGVLTVSCAGGVRADISPVEQASERAEGVLLTVRVTGLKGGHSGSDIHLERGNASRIMGRALLAALTAAPRLRLLSFQGGSKDNAITREATAVVIVPCEKCAARAGRAIDGVFAEVSAELRSTDPDVAVTWSVGERAERETLSGEYTGNLIRFLCLTDYGPQMRDPQMDNFVITSANIGVVNAAEGTFKITCSLRSSVGSQLEWAKTRLSLLAETLGMAVTFREQYPGWSYNPESDLRRLVCDCYRDLFGAEMTVEAIHAGLECGLFCEKLPGLDPVAMGPELANVHTPDETMDAGSFARMYKLLREVLARA